MTFADAFRKVGIFRVSVENGGIYRVRDGAIDFPAEDAADTRTKHDFRTVVVLSNQEQCSSIDEETVLVAPMSHDLSRKHPTDIIIRASAANGLGGPGGRIILSHTQPILKTALQKQFGRFTDSEWDEVVAHLVSNVERAEHPTAS